MFRRVTLSIIRRFSLYTQQWYMSHRFADSLRASKTKSEKLVHLDRLITRIYHDARSPQRQIHYRVNRNPPPVPIRSQINTVHTPTLPHYQTKWNLWEFDIIHFVVSVQLQRNSVLVFTIFSNIIILTLIVLMWRIGWAHNNARK